jgi:hypothetical protein
MGKAKAQRSGVAHAVVHALLRVLATDCLPVFTSDGLKLYLYALTSHFGYGAEVVGRQTHQWQVHAGLLYGQVVKHYTCLLAYTRQQRTDGVEREVMANQPLAHPIGLGLGIRGPYTCCAASACWGLSPQTCRVAPSKACRATGAP